MHLEHNKSFISHRGRNDTYIENTFESFRDALHYGLHIIEVDIRFSKDNVAYLYHSHKTNSTDTKFTFSDESSEFIDKRFYKKNRQKVARLETVLELFLEQRKEDQFIALDIKDAGNEDLVFSLLEKYKLFDKAIIFTWTPQIILKFDELLRDNKRTIPLYFSYLRSDALLRNIYPLLFKKRKGKQPFPVFFDKVVLLDKKNYTSDLGKYSRGYAHIYFSKQFLPKNLITILRNSGGGICINARNSEHELIEAKRNSLKTIVFGPVYGTKHIRNIHHYTHLLYNKNIDYIFLDKAHGVFENPFLTNHYIANVPKSKWLIETILANIVFNLSGVRISKRDNFLSKKDSSEIETHLKMGDLVLLGMHWRMSGLLIGNIVTHSALYLNDNKLIHAVADGVSLITLEECIKYYDTLIILRPNKISDVQRSVVKATAVASLSEPYDFNFSLNDKDFYCTELVNYIYKSSGIEDGINKNKARRPKVIKPIDYLNAAFEIIYHSDSLILNNKKFKLNPKYYTNSLLRWIIHYRSKSNK